jgi:hypothetical protein
MKIYKTITSKKKSLITVTFIYTHKSDNEHGNESKT